MGNITIYDAATGQTTTRAMTTQEQSDSDAIQAALAAETAIGNIITPTFSNNSSTLTGIEDGKMIMLNNSNSSGTLYVPTDSEYSFPTGSQINLIQTGDGQITITASNTSATTINYTPGNKLRAQYSAATLLKTGTNQWLLMGDLSL